MVRVLFDLSGGNSPQIIETFDSPEDTTLYNLADVIVKSSDINAVLGRKNDNPTVEGGRNHG